MQCRLIPETKGRSLEEMDVIFGSITADQRRADIEKRERGASDVCAPLRGSHGTHAVIVFLPLLALEHEQNETTSERSLDNKV